MTFHPDRALKFLKDIGDQGWRGWWEFLAIYMISAVAITVVG